MESIALAIALILPGPSVCGAQGKPAGDCSFPDAGFATTPGQKPLIAEVVARDALELEECGSEKGCITSPAALGTPVLIYREQGEWTCGYFSGREGAGPAWIRSDALRVVPYDARPPLNAWVGTWIGVGGALAPKHLDDERNRKLFRVKRLVGTFWLAESWFVRETGKSGA
jgi:hypothetical protein